MSVHAGSILHIGGKNIIDRIQSAGLGDVRVPTEVVREVGNREVVDKVPGDPDFTFTLETNDVSTEIEAWLNGQVGSGVGSAAGPGAADPDGTSYPWDECGFVNIGSPWKDPATGSAGTVEAGHIVPGYYARRIRYRAGVTDNFTTEVELQGGSYYYADAAPFEDYYTGNGATVAFVSTHEALPHRRGGELGSTFKYVYGVIVDGVLQTEDVDYAVTGGTPPGGAATAVTVTFTVAPANGAVVHFAYFSDDAQAHPDTEHPTATAKPAAVRGRNICVYLGSGGSRAKAGSVQAFELEATLDGEVEREFCNEEIVGLSVNGRDTTGSLTVRSKDKAAFFALLAKVTGVDTTDEVIGFLNQKTLPLTLQIQNPKNPGQILKTLYVDDAIFQVPGTGARVNTPTDFEFRWESQSGNYLPYKGSFLP